jgi:osmotically-inducible protein OsmY
MLLARIYSKLHCDARLKMKNIMCAAIASVVMVGCMNNETPSGKTHNSIVRVSAGHSEPTEFEQSSSDLRLDEKTVRSIRRSFLHNPAVPTNGKDVKLILSDDTITLYGVVKNEKERASIAALARQFAGGKKINNQLEVANRFDQAGNYKDAFVVNR